MTPTLTPISARDLIKRIIAGERDFSSTKLTSDGTTAAEQDVAELNGYLQGQDIRENPILATNADWSGLQAPGIFLQGIRLAGADLSRADLRNADFRRSDLSGIAFRGANVSGTVFVGAKLMNSDFSGATMRGADLYEANLSGSQLVDADLARAYMLRLNLTGADLSGAQLTGVLFYRADLRKTIGLDRTRDLASCQFKHTIVTAAERNAIEAAIQSEPRFDLRDE